ncbi:hypothetical protein [Bifidobacterium pullorum]|uniref:Uncharacterized protein n=1 Tax=Bifidobacterium pullorum subsp. gallinarum TaxID=78344 RepID=A0A921IWS3_9BIFI|nr:hypothetical protein [Bifidobacterium pullorum]HJG40841.1 hypothetical protein [Bifidobacterium pullorum subsp. gallinarum]
MFWVFVELAAIPDHAFVVSGSTTVVPSACAAGAGTNITVTAAIIATTIATAHAVVERLALIARV